MTTTQSLTVMLVENNRADIRLTIEGFREVYPGLSISVSHDGNEAIRWLQAQCEHGHSLPALILLDLSLPRVDGRQVLLVLKNDPRLTHIPVIVLTTSESDDDILRCYQARANCYITKPVEFEQFIVVLQFIVLFWLSIPLATLGRSEPL